MAAQHRISVALCTRNGAEYIEEQLRSILTQTMLPTEVVLSDDASTDDTVERAEKLWTHHGTIVEKPELRILRNQKALGVTKNFEQALLACRGEFIVLSDQDDRWHDTRIERSIQRMDADPSLLLVHTDATLVDEHGSPLQTSLSTGLGITKAERAELLSGDGYRALLRRNLVTGATTVIRRELLEIAVPFPEHWVHDEWLAILAAATHHHGYLPEQLIDYRQHTKNQIGVKKLGLAGKVKRLFEPCADRYRYLLVRSKELHSALQSLGDVIPAGALEQARDKVAHHEERASLPASRWARIAPVMRELATGRYSRFSRGAADVVRDLTQPC